MIRKTHPHRKTKAFTLIEMVMSLSITGILLAACGSILVLSLRSLESEKSPATQTALASNAMQEVAREVSLAISFKARSAEGQKPVILDFLVPDRDGDSAPESIRYEWSGNAGDPLTRSYNSSTPVTIALNVQDFSLSYLTRFRTGTNRPAPPPPQESGEVVLMTHDGVRGGSLRDYDLDTDKWLAQYFKPTLPTNTVSWKITRVRFYGMQKQNVDGTIAVEIRAADSSLKPTGSALATVSISESSLGLTYTLREEILNGPTGLNPSVGACLVLRQSGGSDHAATIRYLSGGTTMPTNTHYMTTSDRGVSWTDPKADEDLHFEVMGTYTTEGPPKW